MAKVAIISTLWAIMSICIQSGSDCKAATSIALEYVSADGCALVFYTPPQHQMPWPKFYSYPNRLCLAKQTILSINITCLGIYVNKKLDNPYLTKRKRFWNTENSTSIYIW